MHIPELFVCTVMLCNHLSTMLIADIHDGSFAHGPCHALYRHNCIAESPELHKCHTGEALASFLTKATWLGMTNADSMWGAYAANEWCLLDLMVINTQGKNGQHV